MKYILAYLVFLFLFYGCQNEEKQFEIDGKVVNFSNDQALFIRDTTGIGLSTVIDTLHLDADGNFNIKNKPLNHTSLLLFNEERPLRLSIPRAVNTPIEIEVDISEPDSLKIKGEQAAFVRFQKDQENYWQKVFGEFAAEYPDFAAGNADSDYLTIQDSIFTLRRAFLVDYFKDSTIPNQEDFVSAEKNSLLYQQLNDLLNGPQSELVEQLHRNPDSSKVDFSDKSIFALPDYREFINNALMAVVRYENPQDNLSSYELYLKKGMPIINRWYKNPELNQTQKLIFINHLITSAKIFKEPVVVSEFQEVIDTLKADEQLRGHLALLEDELNQLDELTLKFSAGATAPDFELEDSQERKYNLSDFKGKILFIDVWASWCKPCISAFPTWNKLAKNHADNPKIEFLSISTDEEKEKWLNSVEKYELQGLKLFAGKGFESTFAKDYEVRALPNYIAIDGEGKILSASSSLNDFDKILAKQVEDN